MTTPTITAGTLVSWKGDFSNIGGDYTVTRVADGWFWFTDGTRERCAPVALLSSPRWYVRRAVA